MSNTTTTGPADTYFVVYLGEHGDGSITTHSRDEILKMVAEQYWGDLDTLALRPGQAVRFGEVAGIMILKGKQVFPQPKKIIETWEVDDDRTIACTPVNAD